MTERRGLLIHPEDISMLWPQRLKEAGINVLGYHPVGGADAAQSLARFLAEKDSAPQRAFRDALEKREIAVEYEMHAMGYMVPRTLFSQKPEIFPMNEEGKRAPGPNLCASSTEAADLLAEAAYRLAKALPAASHRYNFWLDDTATEGCRCPACASLSPSDQQLRLLHAMLRGIKAADPLGTLSYLAYVSTLPVPRQTVPDPAIFLEFAPIRRDHHRPIADPACEKNAAELQGLPEALRFFGTRGAQVLEYWMDNSLFSGWKRPPKPFAPDGAVIAADAAFYRGLGFESLVAFGCFLGPDYEALYGEPPLAEYGRLLRP